MIYDRGADFLCEQLRNKREGIQFERMLRALSFVLHEWCHYDGNRKDVYGERAQVLTSIQFDKLALFLFRLWNAAHREDDVDRLPLHSESQESKDRVTFPAPFHELPGKHGRGPARFDGKRKPIYITESLYALQNEGLFYFEITPPSDTPLDEWQRQLGDGSPNDHRTTVAPGILVTSSSAFLQDLTSREIEILRDFAHAVRHLGASEIRAIGTHENRRKTVEDVVKEFNDMTPHVIETTARLKNGEPFYRHSQEMLEYADEAWRKAVDNREDYSSARQTMIKELADLDLRNLFESSQASPEQIWDHPMMAALAQKAKQARAVSQCVHAIGLFQRVPKTGPRQMRKQIEETWKEGIKGVQDTGVSELPLDLTSAFISNTTEISPNARDQMIEMLLSVSR
jgi:hypothetical protein